MLRAGIVAVAFLSASAAVAQADRFDVYLPLVYDETPTPVVTVTPLAGACVSPRGGVRFRDWLYDMPLEGVVAECYRVGGFAAEDDTTISPQGVFIVILLDVKNRGTLVAEVGLLDSFRLQAGAGYRYDLAPLAVQEAAAVAFGRPTVFSPVSAGATVRQVFTFDIPWGAESLTIVSEFPW